MKKCSRWLPGDVTYSPNSWAAYSGETPDPSKRAYGFTPVDLNPPDSVLSMDDVLRLIGLSIHGGKIFEVPDSVLLVRLVERELKKRGAIHDDIRG